MGYEIKLFVGKSGYSSREAKQSKDLMLVDGEVYYPYENDENGFLVYTGRTEIYFQVYGMVDLCCPGNDSELLKLDWKNKEAKSVCWFFYHTDGNLEVRKDRYGDIAKPVPVADVIAALEKDYEAEEYRRFKWALGFLKAVDPDSEVMLYGH